MTIQRVQPGSSIGEPISASQSNTIDAGAKGVFQHHEGCLAPSQLCEAQNAGCLARTDDTYAERDANAAEILRLQGELAEARGEIAKLRESESAISCCAACKTTEYPRALLAFCLTCRTRAAELFSPQRDVGCAHSAQDWELVCRECEPMMREPRLSGALAAAHEEARRALAAAERADGDRHLAMMALRFVAGGVPLPAAIEMVGIDLDAGTSVSAYDERRRRERTEWPTMDIEATDG